MGNEGITYLVVMSQLGVRGTNKTPNMTLKQVFIHIHKTDNAIERELKRTGMCVQLLSPHCKCQVILVLSIEDTMQGESGVGFNSYG